MIARRRRDEKEDTMKKTLRIALALTLALASLLITGCGPKQNEASDSTAEPQSSFGDDVTYITDDSYYTYYQEFTTNSKDYDGKKFAVDGMFHLTKLEGNDIPQIFRYHREIDPTDGKEYAYYRGFMLKGDAVMNDTPEKAWIRVVGVLEVERHDDHVHVFLNAESFEVLDTPGSEYVE